MSDVYDVLETCLTEVENGADLEATLANYPDHADELRPILNAALEARRMSAPAPSAVVVRRNRSKVLQRAAQMREWEQFSNRSFSSFQGKWAGAFIVLVLMIFGGLNAISASAEALPGDALYSTKRWWEGIRLSFTLDDTLAGEIAEERLNEIDRLFAQGLSERVEFVGFVTKLTETQWQVAHIPVVITAETQLPDVPPYVGMVVRVYGITRSDGVVIAERIEIPRGEVTVPGESPNSLPSATPMATETEPTSTVGTEAPTPTATPSPSPTPTPTFIPANTNPGNANSNDNSNENSNANDDGNGNGDDNGNNGNDNGNDDNNNNGGDNGNG